MSQLSLCLHIFIVMWLLNLVSRATVGLLRKSKPPRWMSVRKNHGATIPNDLSKKKRVGTYTPSTRSYT